MNEKDEYFLMIEMAVLGMGTAILHLLDDNFPKEDKAELRMMTELTMQEVMNVKKDRSNLQ